MLNRAHLELMKKKLKQDEGNVNLRKNPPTTQENRQLLEIEILSPVNLISLNLKKHIENAKNDPLIRVQDKAQQCQRPRQKKKKQKNQQNIPIIKDD